MEQCISVERPLVTTTSQLLHPITNTGSGQLTSSGLLLEMGTEPNRTHRNRTLLWVKPNETNPNCLNTLSRTRIESNCQTVRTEPNPQRPIPTSRLVVCFTSADTVPRWTWRSCRTCRTDTRTSGVLRAPLSSTEASRHTASVDTPSDILLAWAFVLRRV